MSTFNLLPFQVEAVTKSFGVGGRGSKITIKDKL